MTDHQDRLLYVLTARREVSWPSFKQIFDCLTLSLPHIPGGEVGRGRSLRSVAVQALDCLGHAEFEFTAATSRVYVAPAVLVRLPVAGFPEAVLAGARSPETLQQIEQASVATGCMVQVESQSDHPDRSRLIPARITVRSENLSALEAASKKLRVPFVQCPSAWTLANLSTSLPKYLEDCSWQPAGDLNWIRRDFDPATWQFRPSRTNGDEVSLTRFTNPRGGTYRHVLRKNCKSAVVDCDWGRYAVLAHRQLNVLIYDERQRLLAVPASTPLPKLLARAAGLSSGYAPVWIPKAKVPWKSLETWGFDLYRGVPARIAELIASCVGQSLVPRPVNANLLLPDVSIC